MNKVVTKSVKIEHDIWHKARVKALGQGLTMQDLVAKLLTKYLDSQKKGGK